MNAARAALVIATLALGACISVNATMLRPGTSYPPISPFDVEVFLSEDDVEGEYEKVAILFAEGDADVTNPSEMIEAMREKAAELGCNGLIIGDFEEPSTGERIARALLDTQADRRTQALAVRLERAGGE